MPDTGVEPMIFHSGGGRVATSPAELDFFAPSLQYIDIFM